MWKFPRTTLPAAVLAIAAADASAQHWFDAARVLTENAGGYFQGIGDLDGDGDPDLVSLTGYSSFYFDGWRVFANDGTGQFSSGPTTPFPAGFEVTAFHPNLGDVTGDGRLDLVLRARTTVTPIAYGLAVLEGLPGGQFGSFGFHALSGPVTDADFGDIDGDPAREIAVTHQVSGTNQDDLVRWLDWTGGGFSQSSALLIPQVNPTLEGVAAVAAFDFSGDGVADIATASYYGSLLRRCVTVAGAPTLGAATPLAVNTTSGLRLGKGDADGDGDTDLLVWGRSFDGADIIDTAHFAVLRFGPGGSFASSAVTHFVDFEANFDLSICHLIDWNEDGRADLLSHAFANGGTGYGQLGIFLGQPNFTFQSPHTVATSFGGAAVGAADLDGDSYLDFIGPKSIVFGDGTAATLPTRTPIWYSLANVPSTPAAVEDWEGDGDIDLISSKNAIAVNDGTSNVGTLTSTPIAPWPVAPPNFTYEYAVAIGDLDGDGRADHLARFGQFFVFSVLFQNMRLLRDDGTGKFVDAGVVATQSIGRLTNGDLLPVHDLDGDGDADLVADGGFWPNTGTTFPQFVPLFSGSPRDLADVDADGDLDVLAVESTGGFNANAWLASQGPGLTFAHALLTAGDLASNGGRFLDLDADGDLDVALGGRVDGLVRIARNDGPGSWTSLIAQSEPGSTDVLAVADVDGDGVGDLVTASRATGLLFSPVSQPLFAVLRRTSPTALTYETARAWSGEVARAVVDIDEDGDLDVVGGAIVKNRLYRGAEDGIVRQYGAGTAGTGGGVPVLGGSGELRPGSTEAGMHLRRSRGGSIAVLDVGLAQGAFPIGFATTFLIQPPLILTIPLPLTGAPGAAGAGAFDLATGPFLSTVAGLSLYHQIFVVDPAHPLGYAASNGLELIYGL